MHIYILLYKLRMKMFSKLSQQLRTSRYLKSDDIFPVFCERRKTTNVSCSRNPRKVGSLYIIYKPSDRQNPRSWQVVAGTSIPRLFFERGCS